MIDRVALSVVNLCRQSDALRAVEAARHSMGIPAAEMCRRAGLTQNSVIEWRLCRRCPRLSNFIGLADVVGFTVVMRGPDGVESTLRDLPLAVERINDARIERGISFAEMEFQSGVSVSSFFAWRNNRRDPAVASFVALAQTFGFEVEMKDCRQ